MPPPRQIYASATTRRERRWHRYRRREPAYMPVPALAAVAAALAVAGAELLRGLV